MKRYTMQDRSGGIVNRTDANIHLQRVLEMTDYTPEEVDAIADLQAGQELCVGEAKDISILRIL